MSLGRQPPPKPMPALRKRRPIRASWPMASARSTTSAPVDLADLGDGVDEGDLGGQERVGGDLHQLRGGEVGDDDRAAGVDHGGVEVAQPLLGARRRDTEHQAVRLEGVLDREALAEELRVPGQLGPGADRSAPRPSAPPAAAAVPTGTVDLPTTSAGRVRWGASASMAPSTWLTSAPSPEADCGVPDAQEVQVAEVGSLLRGVGEPQSPRGDVAREQLLQPGLVERHRARGQGRPLGRVGLDAEHLVAQLGHARRVGRSEVAAADHRDAHGPESREPAGSPGDRHRHAAVS